MSLCVLPNRLLRRPAVLRAPCSCPQIKDVATKVSGVEDGLNRKLGEVEEGLGSLAGGMREAAAGTKADLRALKDQVGCGWVAAWGAAEQGAACRAFPFQTLEYCHTVESWSHSGALVTLLSHCHTSSPCPVPALPCGCRGVAEAGAGGPAARGG